MAGTPAALDTEVGSRVLTGVVGAGRVVADLDGTGAADALVRAQEAVVAAEVAQVELVAHWADLHATGGRGADSGRVLAGMEQEVRLGGNGTPRVREFAAAELGVLLGMTTHGARALMRDVLDLRHRHPLLWAAVREGRARFWQAREVTRVAERAGLDRDAARHVDARTAPHLGLVPWGRMISLVEAAVVEADPETAEKRRLAAAMERFVRTAQSTEDGTKLLYARVEAGDAIMFVAMCDRIAQILREQGDDAPMDVLRSLAVGWLGTPLRAAALLADTERTLRTPVENVEAETARPALVIDPATDLDRFLPPATLYVHLSLEQLLGERVGAARVEALGPVTLQHAAELMLQRRVTVTPVVDLNDISAVDGYQAPARIREQMVLRHPFEVFPHGTLRSRSADADHVVPYDPGGPPGQTSTTNLAPLARGHHRVKTHGRGWVHRQPVPGVHYWRTPHGHWSRVDHHGTRLLGRSLPAPDRVLLDDIGTPPERAFAALLAAA